MATGIQGAKKFFFDSKAVLSAADKKTRGVLSKFGAFVRRTARSSIRSSKKPGRPGQPPHSHGPGLLKKFIYFVYEPATRGVVIGPARLGGKLGNAPEALEKSGRSQIRTGRGGHRVVKTVNIAARPYMGPAAEKEKKQLPSLWAH